MCVDQYNGTPGRPASRSSRLFYAIPHREKRIEYAIFVETLDHYAGQLLDALADEGLSEHTRIQAGKEHWGKRPSMKSILVPWMYQSKAVAHTPV